MKNYRHADRSDIRTYRSRERGSVMLLVVVALLLISMLGMAYLQTSRLDRATAQTTAKSYIDVVANASMAYIGEVLKSDLITTDDVMFDRSQGIEGYDFPWTSSNHSYTVQFNDGSTDTSSGGQLDDTWLASTEPTFQSGHKGTWPHITNLNGIYLRLPSSDSDSATPDEIAVNNYDNMDIKTRWGFDTEVPINVSNQSNNLDYAARNYEVLGADADGDGIYDSKWTWAPIRQISGISYVMAARIIDNSAMLNMNVALSQANTKDNFPGEYPDYTVTALNPTELDFGNFVFHNGGSTSELKRLMAYRLGISPSSSLTLPVPKSTRYNFWLNGALTYDNFPAPLNKLGILNELELRYRNGLNNPEITTTIEDTSYGMEDFLRGTSTGESTYSSVPDINKMDDYFEKEVRHQLTTVNGAGVFRPSLPNETPGVYTKSNLYNLLTPNSHVDSYSFYKKLKAFYSNTGMSEYSDAQLISMCKQMVMNYVDFADFDNLVSQFYEYDVDGNALGYSGEVAGTTAVMGMEALPFITEVYSQRPHRFSAGWTSSGYAYHLRVNAIADANDVPGFAIEIRNPYENDILLSNVNLWIGDTDLGALDAIAQSQLPDGILKSKQVLIIYKESKTQAGQDDDYNITELISDEASDGYENILVQLADDAYDSLLLYTGSKSSDFNVQLRATRQDGTAMTWAYSKAPIEQYPTNVNENYYHYINFFGIGFVNFTTGLIENLDLDVLDVEAALNNKVQYSQSSVFGNGLGLNALAYPNSQWQINQRDVSDTDNNDDADLYYFASTIDRLGITDKSGSIDSQSVKVKKLTGHGFRFIDVTFDSFDHTQLFDPQTDQWEFPTSGEIDHVADLALVPIVGLEPDTEFAQSLASATKDDHLRHNYMLDMRDNNTYYVSDNTASAYYNMSFGWALMQQFVYKSPESDGLDNDGDSLIDDQDTDELFIPGTINLNTVSANLLNQILPIADTDEREDLVDEIITLRGEPSDNTPGIPSVGDLFKMNSSQWGVATNTPKRDQTLRQRQLGSLANTRSDVYTAYVVIRGYPSGDFRRGAVESKQFLVVYDRSRISTNDNRINILGYYEYD
ncbi:MAG: hypothetical protein CMJ19_23390 [Phycisphaeraceae bacterium]|nr:hypothetical protein [Phycisphaeraceae bacterium]